MKVWVPHRKARYWATPVSTTALTGEHTSVSGRAKLQKYQKTIDLFHRVENELH